MYAIVKTGGKQYRVEPGQTLLVERLPDDAGATVALETILFRSDDAVFDADGLKKVSVKAKIVEHVRGPKLRVFKFKPKRGYKRRTGHRQPLTRIEVTDISAGAATPRAKRAKAEDAREVPQAAAAAPTQPEAAPAPKAKAAGSAAKAKPKAAGSAAKAKPKAAGGAAKPKAKAAGAAAKPAKEAKPAKPAKPAKAAKAAKAKPTDQDKDADGT